MSETLLTFSLKKGDIVKINGIPLRLLADVDTEGATDPQRFSCSQSEASDENPAQAPSPDNRTTSSSSSESM